MIRHFRNRPDELKGCAGHPWGLDAQDDRKVRYRTDSTPSASNVVRWTNVEAFAGLQLDTRKNRWSFGVEGDSLIENDHGEPWWIRSPCSV